MTMSRISPSQDDLAELARIATALGQIGFCLPGSVAVRSYRCGKPRCGCHADPPRLHGPYIQWSRRVGSRTVHVNLTPERDEDCRAFFDNAAHLRSLVAQLEELSLRVAGAASHSEAPRRHQTHAAGQHTEPR